MVKTKILKLALLTYKPNNGNIQRYDESYIKELLYKHLDEIVDKYKSDTIIGLTGLCIGLELDFANYCLINDIDYIVYQAFDTPEIYWNNLPESIVRSYHKALESSFSVEKLSDGGYAPRKNINRKLRMCEDADIILNIEEKDSFKINQEIIKNLKNKIIYEVYV